MSYKKKLAFILPAVSGILTVLAVDIFILRAASRCLVPVAIFTASCRLTCTYCTPRFTHCVTKLATTIIFSFRAFSLTAPILVLLVSVIVVHRNNYGLDENEDRYNTVPLLPLNSSLFTGIIFSATPLAEQNFRS